MKLLCQMVVKTLLGEQLDVSNTFLWVFTRSLPRRKEKKKVPDPASIYGHCVYNNDADPVLERIAISALMNIIEMRFTRRSSKALIAPSFPQLVFTVIDL